METGKKSTSEKDQSQAGPEVTMELLHKLPKADLHCHLDGSLRLSTVLELAEKYNVTLPSDTEEGLAEAIHMGEVCASLTDYLKAFDITCAVLQTEEALERAAFELAEDAAAENVLHLEVRYDPCCTRGRGFRCPGLSRRCWQGYIEQRNNTIFPRA